MGDSMTKLINRTLGGMLDEIVEKFGDREAMVFKDRRYTYKDVKNWVETIAKSLLSIGIGKGSRAGILMGNRPEWLFWAFGVAKVGATLVAINTWYKEKELEYVLKHSDISILLMVDRFLKNDYMEMIEHIIPEVKSTTFGRIYCERVPFMRFLVCFGSNIPKAGMSYEKFLELGKDLSDGILREAQSSVMPDDIVYTIYTSGTTAFPKGVLLKHRSVVENGFNIGEYQRLNENDRAWLPYPLFFSAGSCNVAIATLSHGACLVFQEVFEPGEALRLFEEERITVYHGLSNMSLSIIDHPDLKKRNTRYLDKGEGAPLLKIMESLGPKHLVNMYGLTESCTATTCTYADDPLEIRLQTHGRPFPGVKIKITDPSTGEVLPPREKGEICLKGYNLFAGYYKDPELTTKSFDEEGFFHTGDLGWLDEEGYLHYEGRIKEMIKTGGINVSPQEVEEILNKHPKVKESYVVGIPDEVKGEIVMAFIILKEGEKATEEEMIQYCRESMANFKVPQRIEFRSADQFPRTGSGKVQKNKLIEEVLKRNKGEDSNS